MFESSAKDGIPNGTIIHASWEEDAALACLKAPFLELKKITPKEGTTTQAIHDALDKYVARMNKASSRAAGATYGHVIEEPEKLMVALGSEVRWIDAWFVHKLIRYGVGRDRERRDGYRRDSRGGGDEGLFETGSCRGRHLDRPITARRCEAVVTSQRPELEPTVTAGHKYLFRLFSSLSTEHRTPSAAMLAPYPDRLRSSRSTPAQSSPNANSATTPSSTPTPPPSSHVPSTTSASQHKLFSSRSSTRMRTNSLSSHSPPHHSDSPSPSPSTDHVSLRPFRNSSRRPALNRRPSTSSGVPDQKHQPLIPIVISSSAAVQVGPLSTYHLSSLVQYVFSVAPFRLDTYS